MEKKFTIQIDAWADGMNIPAKFAFGQPGRNTPFAPSDNINPAIRWSNAPTGTKSFAMICHDPDVPLLKTHTNQQGKIIPADLPRVDFFHWVLVNIPANVSTLNEGAASHGITQRGKPVGQTKLGLSGMNDYTQWFADDPEMKGIYGGYDGPCPPWNDSIVHHYHFQIFALDIETLSFQSEFTGKDARQKMNGHIIARASHIGTYSMSTANHNLQQAVSEAEDAMLTL